ncbi:MAG: GNAT family N-acetyltransferase [candidate division Zixibacteria bacterium]|nr:GNAT family N-acetyltransferase [candidate division Zixibacteria bacterium]
MKYEIRSLEITDYDNLIKLWRRCDLPCRPKGRDARKTIAEEMTRVETCFLGMLDSGKLIGAILGTSDGRKGWINRLAIAPEYRRQGLGDIMIKECEKFLLGLGLKVIAALIEGDNTASFAAFKKAGYIYAEDIAYYSKRSSADD